MLIRTQDKKILVNMNITNNIRVVEDKNGMFQIYVDVGYIGANFPIATYSTEKKAMKVLEMIQKFHSTMSGLQYGKLSMVDVQIAMGEYAEFTDFDFFQMPEDVEVV